MKRTLVQYVKGIMAMTMISAALPVVATPWVSSVDIDIGGVRYSLFYDDTGKATYTDKNMSGSISILGTVNFPLIDYVLDENGNRLKDANGQYITTEVGVQAISITDLHFSGCSSLQSVSIPNSVTNIGDCAFYDCSSLQSVSIPNSVTSIGGSAFSGCSSLQRVTIPNSVTSIGICAFYRCSSLRSVTIPAIVTDIREDAFAFCTELQEIIVADDNPVYASYDGALYTKDLKKMLFYPGGRTDIKLPHSAVAVDSRAFDGCQKLWMAWFRTFQKTRYDLVDKMEDRAIATLTINKDTMLDDFVLKDGKAYDAVLYVNNIAPTAVRLTLPNGYTYKCFKGASPLTIPGNSQSILSITRVADTVFLVSREELETVQ